VIQQYKNDMTAILIDAVEAKLIESQKLFDDKIAKMWQNQRTLPSNQSFNPATLDLIDRHLLMLTEKAQCMYDYKNITVDTH